MIFIILKNVYIVHFKNKEIDPIVKDLTIVKLKLKFNFY